MRILVDGLDLSGKTTLVTELLAAFERAGISAVRHRGMLSEHHPFEKPLKRLPLARQARSSGITAAYLAAGFVVDGLLVKVDPPRSDGAWLIQEGYADRTIAVGIAGGPYLPALLALRAQRIFASFDLAVLLHTSDQSERLARLGQRGLGDEGDRRAALDQDFAERFNSALVHHLALRHRHRLIVDTAVISPGEIVDLVFEHLGIEPCAPPLGKIAAA
ncbi:hypothetical protein AB0J21_10965 [Streptomyces sp. NPDC049954]|uniref:hypothetical protein n=1 Tax=Streptomyces sp. NPDC049954 TaxID=3155779 RepID=UPI00342A6826